MAARVLVLGSSGMLGHVLASYLRERTRLDVRDAGPRRAVFPGSLACDIMDPASVDALVRSERPDVLVNCVGVLVKASERRKREATWINAYLPRLLSDLCRAVGCRLIHVSTDCVFSGERGPYAEDAPYDGQDFYGRSKALGEVMDGTDLTVRTSIIGPELRADGTGLFGWLMAQGGEVRGYRNALWSGVTTLELSKFLAYVIESLPALSGLVHYAVPGGISKYELLRSIDGAFGRGLRIIPVDEPRLDKRLVATRTDAGPPPAGYAEQLAELKAWMESHPELYGSEASS